MLRGMRAPNCHARLIFSRRPGHPGRCCIRQIKRPVMGSLVKKRRRKMSKHKYRKRRKANRHKNKK